MEAQTPAQAGAEVAAQTSAQVAAEELSARLPQVCGACLLQALVLHLLPMWVAPLPRAEEAHLLWARAE